MPIHHRRPFVAAFLALGICLGASSAWAQALPNINTLRVQYNSRKTLAKPEGELKAQIDLIDKELAAATRLGRSGEVRRLIAKGTAILAGRPWTDAEEYQASLVIRASAVVVDSSQPQTFRLEQIYLPAAAFGQPLTAAASIRPLVTPIAGSPPPPPLPATELARFDGVPRDLRESPLFMDVDLSAIADGVHVLEVAVQDGDRPLGVASLRLAVSNGLASRLGRLETAAAAAPTDLRADLRYPGDYVRKINRGLIELSTFNVTDELSAAERIAAEASTGANPFKGRTGGFERHYVLERAGEIMPYRVYVPTSYSGSKPFPLIVALHGLGVTEDSFMDSYAKTVPAQAEQRGYIVVAPLGFRVDGFYGFNLSTDSDAAGRRRVELSEEDVLEVLKRMRADYRIDDRRIYLMGHSMGAIGTWAIEAKHPAIWAAAAAFSGLGNPATVEKMRHIPQFVVHGDADPTVSVNGSRTMVAEMKKQGVDHVYVEVPGGNHTDVVVPNIPAAFDFFDKKRKAAGTTERQ